MNYEKTTFGVKSFPSMLNPLLNYPVVGSIHDSDLRYGAAKYKTSCNVIYIEIFCFSQHFWKFSKLSFH